MVIEWDKNGGLSSKIFQAIKIPRQQRLRRQTSSANEETAAMTQVQMLR